MKQLVAAAQAGQLRAVEQIVAVESNGRLSADGRGGDVRPPLLIILREMVCEIALISPRGDGASVRGVDRLRIEPEYQPVTGNLLTGLPAARAADEWDDRQNDRNTVDHRRAPRSSVPDCMLL